MKLLWREMRQNIKGSILSDGFLILQFSVFFWIAIQIIGYYVDLNSHSWVQTIKGDYQYYTLALNDAESSMASMRQVQEDPLYLSNAREVLSQVRAQKSFQYIIATREQSYKVAVEDLERHFKGQSYQDYLAGSLYPGYYGRSAALLPPEPEELFGTQVISMSFTSLDWNAVQHYHLQADKGRVFEETDFFIEEDTRTFPVMLGAAYEPYFQVGDTFSFFFTEEYTARVIGFLKEDSMIITEESREQDSYPTRMDYDIILPIFELRAEPSGDSFESFLRENDTRALLGILVMEADASGSESLNAQKKINEIYRANNLFTVVPVSTSDSIYLFQNETQYTVAMITALVAATAFFNVFSLCLSLSNKIERNLKRYGIELMNGQQMFRIVLAFLMEIIWIIGMAAVAVMIVCWETFYYNPKYFMAVLIPAVVFLTASGGILSRKLTGVNIEAIIRRRDG